jgi:hypothetical protein
MDKISHYNDDASERSSSDMSEGSFSSNEEQPEVHQVPKESGAYNGA